MPRRPSTPRDSWAERPRRKTQLVREGGGLFSRLRGAGPALIILASVLFILSGVGGVVRHRICIARLSTAAAQRFSDCRQAVQEARCRPETISREFSVGECMAFQEGEYACMKDPAERERWLAAAGCAR